ncbi:hypothetical protein IEO21_03154 [Rhodonia placenta]|uniref:Fanconi-associated nuclease n=1 Tax=Rhodonia placenta TaxID=104341 RepID=A0A8H7P6C8_9APHY|nr:hypothetical protein IEO21_03154 [Postia placenta]
MVCVSPPANAAEKLVFGYVRHSLSTADEREGEPNMSSEEDDITIGEKEWGESMYVTLFEEMLQEVLTHEGYLFCAEEIKCLMDYNTLSYGGRYLLIRLCLRKADTWFRLNKLKYERELGDKIKSAIHELCGLHNPSPKEIKIKVEEPEVIDLVDERERPQAGPSRLPKQEPQPCKLEGPDYSTFALDESHADLRELLECLGLDELKNIAKQMKLKTSGHHGRRDELVNALLASTSAQRTLPFASPVSAKGKGKGRADRFIQTTLSFGTGGRRTQADRLREIVVKHLGKCIKLKEDVVRLFRRVNLVYLRSTQSTPSILTPSILSRAKKRSYAEYNHALEIEAEVDALLEGPGLVTGARARSTASKTPGPLMQRFKTPITPRKDLDIHASVSPRSTRSRVKSSHLDELDDSRSLFNESSVDTSADTPRRQAAWAVRCILDDVYPRWQDMVSTKGECDRPQSLIRFESGHILTRVVCKGTYALGTLKEHERELGVLEALLAQRRWRRGRRGRWHERRALILMTHMGKSDRIYRLAMDAVTEALMDEDTHIVFRPKLERRLTTLEKRLSVPENDRHICQGKLDKPDEVSISGVRVRHSATSLVLDRTCRVNNPPVLVKDEKPGLTQLVLPWLSQKPDVREPETTMAKVTGKSIWRGWENEEVNVETLALQHYEEQGYKGFHCEGRIVSTLFGLLFWDVIFASVPGAFETPYQAAPLDIAEDTFYHSRKEVADRLLVKLREGAAEEILERVHNEHAEKKTWCVGVRWEMFEKQDLLDIVKCLGGPALEVICRLLCEDYAGRVGGVPDLIIWNAEAKECKFIEVKGPGDKLQENQKVWIDVLLQAGIPVEVCHVFEEEGQDPLSRKRKAKTKTNAKSRKRSRRLSSPADERPIVESEGEEEIDYSQLDKHDDDDKESSLPPVTPERRPPRKLMEVIITSSPSTSGSSTKKRRIMSPEV